jgi:signal transduction histidine kinase
VFTTRDGLSSNSILALALDGHGGLWVGTQAGLDHVADGHVRRVHAGEVSSLQEDSRHRLWIGTNSGAAVLEDGRVSWLENARLPVLALGEAGGRIYAATQTAGVLVFSQSTLEQLPAEELSLRDVDAFYRDADGSLWLGTAGSGLALLNGGKLVGFSMRDGLFDDDIYGIASDDRGRLWLACSKGIFSVDRADLKNFAAGKIKAIPSTPYSPLDGLQTVECKAGVQPGAWRMRNGYISFSTIRGLLLIDPNHIEPKMTPPLVVIEAVTVDGRDGTPSRMPEIEAGERNLQFGYTGVSFRSPTRLTFRYKLEGFDHNWIEAGTRREAFYTNLPPGSYRFLVSSCNYDGTCSESAASVVFTLPARFYQRRWFWPACVLLVALLTRLAYSIRIKQLKRDFNLVLAERGRIARELHDTLIQGFSGVTMQMQALAARLSPEHKSRLHDIIEDSAGCLREARRSVANLRNSDGQSGLADAITQAAKQSVGSAGTHLRLHLDPIADRLAPEVEYNLVRIAQEAVTNAVKHSGAATIDVRLTTADSGVRLSVRDDGRGFVPSPAAGHYGLVGMQERARSIGAELQVKSEVGKGTTVSVKTPVRAARAAAKSESSWATERL